MADFQQMLSVDTDRFSHWLLSGSPLERNSCGGEWSGLEQCLLTLGSGNRLVFYDGHLRKLYLCELSDFFEGRNCFWRCISPLRSSSKDTADASPSSSPSLSVFEAVSSMSMNVDGSRLLLDCREHVFVASLPPVFPHDAQVDLPCAVLDRFRLFHSKTTSMVCKWHPLSPQHIGVLDCSSGVFRMYNVDVSMEHPEQTFSLLDMIVPSGDQVQKWNLFVDFDFACSEGAVYHEGVDSFWHFSVVLVSGTGRIYCLCPVFPGGCHVSARIVKAMERELSEMRTRGGSAAAVFQQSIRLMNAWLVPDAARGSASETYFRTCPAAAPSDLVLSCIWNCDVASTSPNMERNASSVLTSGGRAARVLGVKVLQTSSDAPLAFARYTTDGLVDLFVASAIMHPAFAFSGAATAENPDMLQHVAQISVCTPESSLAGGIREQIINDMMIWHGSFGITVTRFPFLESYEDLEATVLGQQSAKRPGLWTILTGTDASGASLAPLHALGPQLLVYGISLPSATGGIRAASGAPCVVCNLSLACHGVSETVEGSDNPIFPDGRTARLSRGSHAVSDSASSASRIKLEYERICENLADASSRASISIDAKKEISLTDSQACSVATEYVKVLEETLFRLYQELEVFLSAAADVFAETRKPLADSLHSTLVRITSKFDEVKSLRDLSHQKLDRLRSLELSNSKLLFQLVSSASNAEHDYFRTLRAASEEEVPAIRARLEHCRLQTKYLEELFGAAGTISADASVELEQTTLTAISSLLDKTQAAIDVCEQSAERLKRDWPIYE